MKGLKRVMENIVPILVFGLGVLMVVLAVAQFVRNQDEDSTSFLSKLNVTRSEMVPKMQYEKEHMDLRTRIEDIEKRNSRQDEFDAQMLAKVANQDEKIRSLRAQPAPSPTPSIKFPKTIQVEVTHAPKLAVPAKKKK